MFGPSYPMDGATVFHMLPLSYTLRCSWDICVFVRTYGIRKCTLVATTIPRRQCQYVEYTDLCAVLQASGLP